jgi:ATP-dependent 26S proteasome regulatory subunit
MEKGSRGSTFFVGSKEIRKHSEIQQTKLDSIQQELTAAQQQFQEKRKKTTKHNNPSATATGVSNTVQNTFVIISMQKQKLVVLQMWKCDGKCDECCLR